MLRALLLDTTVAFLMLDGSAPADDPLPSDDPAPTDESGEMSTEQPTQMAPTQTDRVVFNLAYLHKIEAELGSAACRDEDTYCHDWTLAGYCVVRREATHRHYSYANYMQRFCRRSCGYCRVDLDNTAERPRFVITSSFEVGMKVKLRGSSSVTAEYAGYTATIISHTGIEYKIRLVSDDKEDELSDEEKEKEITVTQDDMGLTEDDEKDAKDQTEKEKEKKEEGEKEEEEKEKKETGAEEA